MGGSTTLGGPWVPTLGQPWVATHPGWRVGDHKNWKIARKTMFVKGNHAYRISCTKVPPNGDSHYINPCAMCYDGSPDPLYNVSKHCASSDGDSLPQEFHGDFAIEMFPCRICSAQNAIAWGLIHSGYMMRVNCERVLWFKGRYNGVQYHEPPCHLEG